jgi:hypothetical protein
LLLLLPSPDCVALFLTAFVLLFSLSDRATKKKAKAAEDAAEEGDGSSFLGRLLLKCRDLRHHERIPTALQELDAAARAHDDGRRHFWIALTAEEDHNRHHGAPKNESDSDLQWWILAVHTLQNRLVPALDRAVQQQQQQQSPY